MKRDSRMRVFLLRRRYLLLGAALALAAAMLFAACLPELLIGSGRQGAAGKSPGRPLKIVPYRQKTA